MAYSGARRKESALKRLLDENPLYTDRDLAEELGVSVATVRLYRSRLGIPELRQRLKDLASAAHKRLKSLEEEELIGELVDLEPNVRGISILETTPEMVLSKSNVVGAEYIFAQANSLAIALIEADVVVTGSARVRYKGTVMRGERLIAKARVAKKKGNKYLVSVHTRVGNREVFVGRFIVVSLKAFSDDGGGECNANSG